MQLSTLASTACDLAGTGAFAISGAMVACRKGADLFGILFLAVITALGGGMMRDVLLGRVPPAIFFNRVDVILSLAVALVVFFMARYHKSYWSRQEERVERINNVIDAIGLGFFSVTGCLVTIEMGLGDHWMLTVSMGMITAVGGGLLRDMILLEIPGIFTKHIYAVAAMAGAVMFYGLYLLEVQTLPAAVSAVSITFVLRLLATYYQWNLPRP